MSLSYNFKVLGAAAVLGALMSVEGIAGTDTVIKVDGSSTMYPITEEGAKKFQATKKEPAKVSAGLSRTGGGVAQIFTRVKQNW